MMYFYMIIVRNVDKLLDILSLMSTTSDEHKSQEV
jgi:hypothetical protein